MEKILKIIIVIVIGFLSVFLYFYLSTFGNQLITAPIAVLADKKEPHAIWAEFFTMLAGIGGLLSPFISIATIGFLNGQVQDQKDQAKAQMRRDDVLSAFRDCCELALKFSVDQMDISAIRRDLVTMKDSGGQAFQLNPNPPINCTTISFNIREQNSNDSNPSGTTVAFRPVSLEFPNNFVSGDLFATVNQLQDDYNLNIYEHSRRIGGRINSNALTLKSQIEYLLELAIIAQGLGIDQNLIKYRLSLCENIPKLLIRGKFLDEKFEIEYMACMKGKLD